jgi:serine phosphatase RsbU (regulator of sigma subunit)
MPALVHRSGAKKGEQVPFERNVLLGRGPLSDLQVKDAAVSHRHALITVSGGKSFVSDLQSGNGTFLNGQRVTEPQLLATGDELRIGSTLFEYVAGGDQKPSLATSVVRIGDLDGPVASGSIVISLSGLQAKSRKTKAIDEVVRLKRRLDFFHEVGRSLARTLDETELIADLLEKTMSVLPQADRAFVVLYRAETGEFVPCAARTRSGRVTEIPASKTLLEEAVRRREAVASIDAAAEADFKDAASVHQLNLRAVACVPLLVEERVLGVLQLDNVQHANGFTEADLDLLAGIAGPIALAIEHARVHRRMVDRELLEHDLALARRIQQSFLPAKLPEPPGWHVAVEYSPQQAVGGDLYDFIALPDGRLGIALGDVSGKGVSGALFMARLTSALRTAAARSPYPSDVLEELNELLAAEAAEGMFVTLAYGTLDFASGRLEMASAGHLPPLLRHADGRCGEVRLKSSSPLGVKKPLSAPTFGWEIQRGTVVVLMTDGLSEAMSPAGEQFETQRVVEALRTAAGPPATVLEAILHAARAHVATRGFDDDLTVLCVGRE